MAFEYNPEALQPFIGEADPDYQDGDYFHGRAAFPNALQENDSGYFYHATTMRNLLSILETGLDPNRGGIGGAGTIIAGEDDYQSAMNLEGFNQNSAGYVFASGRPSAVVSYAYEYDKKTDDAIGQPNSMRNAPVVLRFRQDILQHSYEDDPDDPEAIRTQQPIMAEQLEILTEGGWTALADEDVRNEIALNVMNVLGINRGEEAGYEAGEGNEGEDTGYEDTGYESGEDNGGYEDTGYESGEENGEDNGGYEEAGNEDSTENGEEPNRVPVSLSELQNEEGIGRETGRTSIDGSMSRSMDGFYFT